jgi:hypothetical protein
MGHLLKIKCVDSMVNVDILALTSVPFTPTKVQVPNLAPTHKKRETGCKMKKIKLLLKVGILNQLGLCRRWLEVRGVSPLLQN